jgi:hypothetical protein
MWRSAQESSWTSGTGAGLTVPIAAALGMLVGVVIVAQPIYAATVNHPKEYGTLLSRDSSWSRWQTGTPVSRI